MILSQRSANIAKRWLEIKTKDLKGYKDQQTIVGTVDYDELETMYSFLCCPWFCRIQYSIKDFITIEFGYKIEGKPDYMRKILCEDSFKDDNMSFVKISSAIDSFVNKQIVCSFCDNGNKIFLEDMCKHCYIFGSTYEDDCAICLSKDFGVWLKTCCNHKFHYKCYNRMRQKMCPLCRTVTGNNIDLLDE